MQTDNRFLISSGKRIAARVRWPENEETGLYPAIVLNHGYSGDKDEYNEMAKFLCENGFITLQFDSRGCGESEAEKGRMFCATEWYEDAQNAVSFLQTLAGVKQDCIGYTGCSMGGAVTIFMASQDPRVKCAVAMAPYAYADTIENNWLLNVGPKAYEAFQLEIEEDCRNVVCGKPSKIVSVPYALGMNTRDTLDFQEFREQNPGMIQNVPMESVYFGLIRNNPYVYADTIDVPLMVIHGDADTIIPIESSVRLMERVHAKKELIVIPHVIHALPTSDQRAEVFGHALRWFREYLC